MPLQQMPVTEFQAPPIGSGFGAAPVVEEGHVMGGQQPIAMQGGGLVSEAREVQQAGRYGDAMLVHMNPEEAMALNEMGNAGLGGLRRAQMTINPQTGLPEMFSFKDALPAIAGIVGGMFGGPIGAGLASGLTTFATTKGDIGRSLLAGLGAWGSGELMATLGGSGAASQMAGAGTSFTPGSPNLTASIGGPSANFASGMGNTLSAAGGNAVMGQGFNAGAFPSASANLSSLGGAPAYSVSSAAPSFVAPPPVNPIFSPGVEQAALAAGNLPNATAQSMADAAGRKAYSLASFPEKLGYMGSGLSNINPTQLSGTGIGGLGLSDVGIPALAATTGIAGGMVPPPPVPSFDNEEKVYSSVAPPPADYGYNPPPPDYRPGIDPPWDYYRRAKDGGYVNDLPTVNAKFGLKDLGRALSPAYALASGGIEGLLSSYSLPYMASQGQYGLPDEEDALRNDDIDNSGAMASPPPVRISGGNLSMQGGTKGMMTGDFTASPEVMSEISDSQLLKYLRDEGFTPEEIQSYLDPETKPFQVGTAGGIVGDASTAHLTADSNPDSPTLTDIDLGRKDAEELRSVSHLLGPETVNQIKLGRQIRQGPRGGTRLGYTMGQESEAADAARSGVMSFASPQAQSALAERMAVTPEANQPQNAEERAIYDNALLALQGVLEEGEAQQAIDEFIEVFGPEAYRELEAIAANEMDDGGIVEPANGETTIAEGEIQGPDIIPGKIVNPVTGEETANLRVGENEYIEPADSLERRAMAAGLPPEPRNGAMIRGMEERQLEAMYG